MNTSAMDTTVTPAALGHAPKNPSSGADMLSIPVLISHVALKKAVWLYILLLIFEGALRKWFLPGLATPLLIIRDPLAMWMLYEAWRRGIFPANHYITSLALITLISGIATLLLGHRNMYVMLFGARVLLLHFPIMFVMATVLDQNDVVRIGKLFIWLAVPMFVIICLQFNSPQHTWINRGIGGDEHGSGFAGALGYFRPSATFSFSTGTTQFYGMLTAFVFFFWLRPNLINKLLLVAATLSLFAAIPVTISRGVLFQIVVALLFMIIASAKNVKFIFRLILTGLLLALAFFALKSQPLIATAMDVFATRIDQGSRYEGGLQGTLGDRFLGELTQPFKLAATQPFWGYGMGKGTNVGSMLLTGGTDFLIAENEWGRLIGEMGLYLGLGIILIRASLALNMIVVALKRITEENFLPWMLLSNGFLLVLQGQWSAPTSLGFSTIAGGLILAAMKDPPKLKISIAD